MRPKQTKSASVGTASRKQPWRKILYGNKDYPDNYTDPQFLNDLQKNINVQVFEYSEAVLGATKLTHQLSLIVVFLLIFHNFHAEHLYVSAEALLLIVSALCVLGYLVFIVLHGPRCTNDETFSYVQTIRDDLKTVACVIIIGFILSPMLHTLAKSISTDTIYTITFFVFLLHIMCYDYGMPAALVSRAISLNAAIFGTICLASRLSTSLDAFAFLLIAVTLFAIYPCMVRVIEQRENIGLRLIPVVVFSTASCLGLWVISPILFLINVMVLVFCGLIYPVLFCYAQKYKNNIHGPWDEAVVHSHADHFRNWTYSWQLCWIFV